MLQKNEYLASALDKLHSKNEDFIIIGLTGRTGSGCTTAAKILAKEKKDLKHALYTGSAPETNVHRKEKILYRFYKKNWQPFTHLRVSSILTLMLLETESLELSNFLKSQELIRKTDLDFIFNNKQNIISKQSTLSASEFYINFIDKITDEIRNKLEEAAFVKLYQLLGRNARCSGKVTDKNMKHGQFFSIAEKINKIIEDIHHENKRKHKSTYITIDAIRNPLEARYFQERYASFYLLAISCDEKTRKLRLSGKNLSAESIRSIDENEYSSLDINNEKSFTDQDIQGCLQKADVYIDSNPITDDSIDSKKHLTTQLIKLVSLAQKPGLITPSPEERCMQVAYTSKLNSGCLSRQVGAVVTKSNFSIKSVGWNDAPFGQVPCNLRSLTDLKNKRDDLAYSPFEKNNSVFQQHIKTRVNSFDKSRVKGYNLAYCFKSEYNLIKKDKNQVHTRSLHAEENAFLQISKDGGEGVKDGFLFTTASPCELCAKKAYQLGIKKIFYIDPYPGISFDHILSAGSPSDQPQMVLFNGAIGRAFHNLYTPIASYKDELNALRT